MKMLNLKLKWKKIYIRINDYSVNFLNIWDLRTRGNGGTNKEQTNIRSQLSSLQ